MGFAQKKESSSEGEMLVHQSRGFLGRSFHQGVSDGFVILLAFSQAVRPEPVDLENRAMKLVKASLQPDHHLAVIENPRE